MMRRALRERRVRRLDRLRAAGHEPEVVRASGPLGSAFGPQFDYVWCPRCGRRDMRMLPRRLRPLSADRPCEGFVEGENG